MTHLTPVILTPLSGGGIFQIMCKIRLATALRMGHCLRKLNL